MGPHCLEVGVLGKDAVEMLAVGGVEEGTELGGREGGCAASEGGEVAGGQHVDLQETAGRAVLFMAGCWPWHVMICMYCVSGARP